MSQKGFVHNLMKIYFAYNLYIIIDLRQIIQMSSIYALLRHTISNIYKQSPIPSFCMPANGIRLKDPTRKVSLSN